VYPVYLYFVKHDNYRKKVRISVTFSTSSWLIANLVIMAAIPVKIGAELFGALNKDIKYCALTVVLKTTAAILLVNILGEFLGLILSLYL